ncbi:hypothetical protein M5K25_012489 [Dendrobium thyrsiflorum]|uniref:Uncharacterized protein n=1 Tax=Dendrobium thyrsiflorum TaxID=117978 RepID=A0ABD0UXL0_DENTH
MDIFVNTHPLHRRFNYTTMHFTAQQCLLHQPANFSHGIRALSSRVFGPFTPSLSSNSAPTRFFFSLLYTGVAVCECVQSPGPLQLQDNGSSRVRTGQQATSSRSITPFIPYPSQNQRPFCINKPKTHPTPHPLQLQMDFNRREILLSAPAIFLLLSLFLSSAEALNIGIESSTGDAVVFISKHNSYADMLSSFLLTVSSLHLTLG